MRMRPSTRELTGGTVVAGALGTLEVCHAAQ